MAQLHDAQIELEEIIRYNALCDSDRVVVHTDRLIAWAEKNNRSDLVEALVVIRKTPSRAIANANELHRMLQTGKSDKSKGDRPRVG